MGWSTSPSSYCFGANQVSIPERVWGGLEHPFQGVGGSEVFVSIPERVWGGLERSPLQDGKLLGLVSIPERVWGGLERAIE